MYNIVFYFFSLQHSYRKHETHQTLISIMEMTLYWKLVVKTVKQQVVGIFSKLFTRWCYLKLGQTRPTCICYVHLLRFFVQCAMVNQEKNLRTHLIYNVLFHSLNVRWNFRFKTHEFIYILEVLKENPFDDQNLHTCSFTHHCVISYAVSWTSRHPLLTVNFSSKIESLLAFHQQSLNKIS